ncbi:MAG TPA: type IV toxin-antitoxin system AbiEi family antitoxin [Hyphomicrobiaceae bacterium]|nr:type IV toxin-antitoxin system AbiEi family antitoxin [Hyphomicrobiaceae bacterium]
MAQRLRELFPRARGWEETADARIGSQTVDLLAKFKLGDHEQTMVIDVVSLGQPRQIRAAVTKMSDVRKVMPAAYPVASSVYIGSQSAKILKDNGLGFVDLSGNCYLAFEHVLIEKDGKRNVRPSTRPLRSLFAPRATRVVRALLAEPGRAWRLEELAKAAAVSLGHSHNVVKRLEDLRWVERDEAQRIHLGKPADLLDAWCESYSYRTNEMASYFVSERVSRRLMADLAKAATADNRRYAFTLSAGLSLVAPQTRLGGVHCYLEGDPAPIAAALGLHPAGEADGSLHLLAPYDPGVFHGSLDKAGLKVVCLPQLYADLARYERRGAEQAEHLRREAMGY